MRRFYLILFSVFAIFSNTFPASAQQPRANGSTGAICQTSGRTDSNSENDSASLFGKRWTLTEIGKQLLNADKPNIEFDRAQNRVSGDAGCNRFSGEFEINGASLKLSRLASTR